LYADLVGAHLLATVRETLVVGRCMVDIRFIGVRDVAGSGVEPLFDVDVERASEDWTDDRAGRRILDNARWGPQTAGRTQEVQARSVSEMRSDVAAVIG
jgi:hypothetical protein